MTKSSFVAMSALAVILATIGHGPIRASDGSLQDVLKKNGMKVLGSLWVLESESEFKSKLSDARRQGKQLSYAVMQQQGTMSVKDYQDTIKGLTAQISQMKSQINAYNQQMRQLPRGRRGRLANSDFQAEYAELLMYRNQLQYEVGQESAWLSQLKSQKFDKSSKEKIDSEVRDRGEAYHQTILDLRTLVDSITEKYAELKKSDEVKQALIAAGKGVRDKPKLGPSHEFLDNVKLFQKLEKSELGEDTKGSKAKPLRRSRTGSKSRRSGDDFP